MAYTVLETVSVSLPEVGFVSVGSAAIVEVKVR
jgi:hypothetical protein